MSQSVRIRPLGATELRRRVWHSAPGLLPALPCLIPHRDPLGPLGRSVALLLAAGVRAAVAGALAESIPSRVNDNVRVGLAAATTAAALHLWLVRP